MLDMCTLNQYRYGSHEIRFIMLIVVVLGSTYLYLIGLFSMALFMFERNSIGIGLQYTRGERPKVPHVHRIYRRITPMTF